MAKKEIKLNTGNITVYAENRENAPGFNVYLGLSGHEEFLMCHRHNGLLYEKLKGGISLSELQRMKIRATGIHGRREDRRKRITRADDAKNYLLRVIDEFLMDYYDEIEVA